MGSGNPRRRRGRSQVLLFVSLRLEPLGESGTADLEPDDRGRFDPRSPVCVQPSRLTVDGVAVSGSVSAQRLAQHDGDRRHAVRSAVVLAVVSEPRRPNVGSVGPGRGAGVAQPWCQGEPRRPLRGGLSHPWFRAPSLVACFPKNRSCVGCRGPATPRTGAARVPVGLCRLRGSGLRCLGRRRACRGPVPCVEPVQRRDPDLTACLGRISAGSHRAIQAGVAEPGCRRICLVPRWHRDRRLRLVHRDRMARVPRQPELAGDHRGLPVVSGVVDCAAAK